MYEHSNAAVLDDLFPQEAFFPLARPGIEHTAKSGYTTCANGHGGLKFDDTNDYHGDTE